MSELTANTKLDTPLARIDCAADDAGAYAGAAPPPAAAPKADAPPVSPAAACLPAATPGVSPAERDALSDIDTQLMLRVRDGDHEAADVLVRRYFPRVARYIGRLVREQRVVEDLTQDVFLNVVRHAATYEPTAKFSTWLYRIATNRALKHIKLAVIRRRVSGTLDGSAAGIPDPHVAPPDGQAGLRELKRQVSEAVSSLPLRQRLTLTLFEYEEMSYEQIAVVLDVSVESVRSLLARARADLRMRLMGLP